MKHLLLPLALLLAAGCSEQETLTVTRTETSAMQFAAAVDPLPGLTRADVVSGETTWAKGDLVGITALIDGTPFIPKIPYEVTDASDFSTLAPVDEAILWNESVTGKRTFFAVYPYDVTDEETYAFEIPASQTVVEGRNAAHPVLVGRAETDATLARPVSLRFTHLFPIIEVRFDPFAETTIQSLVIEPAEGAVLDGSLTARGSVDRLGGVHVEAGDADRIEISMEGGLKVDAGASVQIPVGRFNLEGGGLQLTATADDGRVFGHKFFEDAPFRSYVADADGGFLQARYITLKMPLEVVSDETSEIFFKDAFDWVRDAKKWNDFTGGGWPTVTAANSPTGKANYFTLNLLDNFTTIGYTAAGTVQARAEGFVALGVSGSRGALTTPELSAIGEEPADLLVSCYLANYASASGTPDTGSERLFPISVEGPGQIGRDGAVSTEVMVDNIFGWKKYWVIVYGATAQTRLTFGVSDDVRNGRMLLDNILIGRAIKGAEPGSREVADTSEPFIRFLEGAEGISLTNEVGAEGTLIVQSNRSWSAQPDADWFTVEPVEANNAGIAHRLTLRATELNRTGRNRTATVTFTAGETVATVSVTQGSEVLLHSDDFAWATGGKAGGIFDGELTSSTAIGSNGSAIGSWSEEWLARGYTGERLYAKAGCLTLGIAGNHGSVVFPTLEAVGEGMDVVVEYDVLEYKNAKETGKSVFRIEEGEGTIVSLEGAYEGVAGDSYTGLSADKRSYNYYCGDYKKWENGARWHRIRVVVSGMTSTTRLAVTGNGANSRFWFDNLKIIRKMDE